MAISDRITSIEEHIKESYQELEGIGIDTTGVNNNLENIPKLIDGYWETLPKVTGEGTSITLDNTKEGKMKINLKGNTNQVQTTQSANLFDENKYLTETFTTGTYKYALANFKGNRTLYVKAQVKSGKTAISNLFVAFTSNGTNPNSGTSHFVIRYAVVNNGSISFSNIDDIYVSFYPTSYTWEQINEVYDIWVSTNDVNYVPFVPDSPSPDYPQDIHVVSGDNTIIVSNSDNTQSQSYPINLGNIELCKIGDYQDKIFKNTPNTTDYDSNLEDNVWYLKKKIGKKDNLVSDFVSVFTNYSNLDYIRFLKPSDSATKGNATNIPALLTSGKYAMNYNFNNADYINYFSPNGEYTNFWFGVTKGTTTEQAQTILTNSTLYYPLATPTYTEITDSTLLSQLNALAKSYEGQTNISQESNDLASILNATALEEME